MKEKFKYILQVTLTGHHKLSRNLLRLSLSYSSRSNCTLLMLIYSTQAAHFYPEFTLKTPYISCGSDQQKVCPFHIISAPRVTSMSHL